MSKVKIEISAEFGSEFQRNFARDALMIMLKAYGEQVEMAHKENGVSIQINGDYISNLDHFNWED